MPLSAKFRIITGIPRKNVNGALILGRPVADFGDVILPCRKIRLRSIRADNIPLEGLVFLVVSVPIDDNGRGLIRLSFVVWRKP